MTNEREFVLLTKWVTSKTDKKETKKNINFWDVTYVVWYKFTDLSQDRDSYTLLRLKAGELRKSCTRLHGVKSHIPQSPL
jgi:hypothetical protein